MPPASACCQHSNIWWEAATMMLSNLQQFLPCYHVRLRAPHRTVDDVVFANTPPSVCVSASSPFPQSRHAWSMRVSLSAPQTHCTGCKTTRTQFLALARFIGTFWCHPQRGGLTWTSQGGPCTGQTPCGLPYSLCGMWLSEPLTSLFRTYRMSRKHLYCRITCCSKIKGKHHVSYFDILISSRSIKRRTPVSGIWKCEKNCSLENSKYGATIFTFCAFLWSGTKIPSFNQ